MKNRNITETNDPLGMFLELLEMYTVDDPAHTITAASTKYSLDIPVIQHGLKIVKSFFIGTGKIILRVAMCGCTQLHIITPAIQRFYASLHFLYMHKTCRRNNADRITFL